MLVGLNRSFSSTEASIRRELFKPLTASPQINFSPSIFLLAPPKGFVTNAWSGEHGHVEKGVPLPLRDIPIGCANQDQLEGEVRGLAERCLQIDNTWHDDGATILNSLIFLKALSLAKRFIAKESEVVIFARPNIEIDRGLRIVHYVRRCANSRPNVAPASLFPDWYSSGAWATGLQFFHVNTSIDILDESMGWTILFSRTVPTTRSVFSLRFIAEQISRSALTPPWFGFALGLGPSNLTWSS